MPCPIGLEQDCGDECAALKECLDHYANHQVDAMKYETDDVA